MVFSIVFTIVYERFSYGESSAYMRAMFLIPLLGAGLSFLSGFNKTWIRNRISWLFFNSSLAIATSACLIKGIIEVSGRTTTYDNPYWVVAIGFLLLSFLSGMLPQKAK